MANHCVEVHCTSCGAEYCLRGCTSMVGGPDAGIVESIKEMRANGELDVFNLHTVPPACDCPVCHGNEVLMGFRRLEYEKDRNDRRVEKQ